MQPEWPCSGEELTRRLGWPRNQEPASGHALKTLVRPLLKKLGCPRAGSYRSAQHLVSEEMAVEVAQRLKRALRM